MFAGLFAGLLVGSRAARRSLYTLVAFGIPVAIWVFANDSRGRQLGLILLVTTAAVYVRRVARPVRSERLKLRDRY